MNGMGGSGLQAGSDDVRIPRFVLEDSPKLAKKLAQFEEQQQKAKEAAAVLGDINEIEGIKAQEKKAREDADKALAEALEKSEAIVEEANTQAQLIIDKATQEAAAMKDSAADLKTAAEVVKEAADAQKSQAARDAANAATVAKAAENKENALQKRAEDLDARELSVQREKEQLAKLSEHIRQTVG